jgi:DNA-binding NtrC family response regulator
MPAPAPDAAAEMPPIPPSAPPPDATPAPATAAVSGSYAAPPASPEVVSARPSPASGDEHPLVLRIPVGTPLAEAERLLILKTLEVSDGNKQRAARILGISRRGLYTKLAAYGEHVPAEEAAENVNGENGGLDTPTPNA